MDVTGYLFLDQGYVRQHKDGVLLILQERAREKYL